MCFNSACPHTNIQPGYPMPTHSVFHTMLPIAVVLAGQKALLSCYHNSRKVAHVPFTTGFSQGNVPRPGISFLALHFGIHVTLQQFPDVDVKAYCTMDKAPPMQMPLLLKDCSHLDINLTKPSLIALQFDKILRECPSKP